MSKGSERAVERRINAILWLLAVWMGAWGVSLWAFFLRTAPVPGIGNLEVALGWQGIAGLLAIAVFGIGFGLPDGHGVRRVAAVPLGMALFVMVIWGVLASGVL